MNFIINSLYLCDFHEFYAFNCPLLNEDLAKIPLRPILTIWIELNPTVLIWDPIHFLHISIRFTLNFCSLLYPLIFSIDQTTFHRFSSLSFFKTDICLNLVLAACTHLICMISTFIAFRCNLKNILYVCDIADAQIHPKQNTICIYSSFLIEYNHDFALNSQIRWIKPFVQFNRAG